MESPKTICLKFEEQGPWSELHLIDWDRWNDMEQPPEGFAGYVRADVFEAALQQVLELMKK